MRVINLCAFNNQNIIIFPSFNIVNALRQGSASSCTGAVTGYYPWVMLLENQLCAITLPLFAVYVISSNPALDCKISAATRSLIFHMRRICLCPARVLKVIERVPVHVIYAREANQSSDPLL